MTTFETYSKRKKGLPDIYVYEKIEGKLKTQIYHIWNKFFDRNNFRKQIKDYARKFIFDTICEEEGEKQLYYSSTFINEHPIYQVESYFDKLEDTDKILDVVEITFYVISKLKDTIREEHGYFEYSYSVEEAIKDLNYRFKENGVGYEFTNLKIIRIDDKVLHKETVNETLQLLLEPDYQNANEEYLTAHSHYRYNRFQDCLNYCLKSFETTIKIICKKNDWIFKENDTAKPLINYLINNKFFKKYHESQLHALRQLLEGSIPTIRNKNSAHGQGTKKIEVSESLASYMLYITGATIRLLIETQNKN